MLNGDAHHSLMWVVEPRIWPLLNCQRRLHRKRQGSRRKQKNRNLGWPLVKGAKESADVGSPDLLRGLWGIQPRFIRDSPVRVVIDPIPPQLVTNAATSCARTDGFAPAYPLLNALTTRLRPSARQQKE